MATVIEIGCGYTADHAEPNQFMDREEDCLHILDIGWNDVPCNQLHASYCGR